MPNERTYASIENEQTHRLREAADAIFKAKEQTAAAEDARSETKVATESPQPVRRPRILAIHRPEPELAPEPKSPVEAKEFASEHRVAEIPRLEYGRIIALATYGMTIKQIAEVYGVASHKIEQGARTFWGFFRAILWDWFGVSSSASTVVGRNVRNGGLTRIEVARRLGQHGLYTERERMPSHRPGRYGEATPSKLSSRERSATSAPGLPSKAI
jgi:hypothetical protein